MHGCAHALSAPAKTPDAPGLCVGDVSASWGSYLRDLSRAGEPTHSLDAVQPATDTLEASAARVMVNELATNAMRTSLRGFEVATLLVCLGLKPKHVGIMTVLHTTSIA